MSTVTVGTGGSRAISQSGTDDVSFLGLGTLDIAGTASTPINVTLSSVAGVGLLDTINITNANVTVDGTAGVSALTNYNVGSGATLTFGNTAQVGAGDTVNFTSPNAYLAFDNAAGVSALGGISGFMNGDRISLPGVAASVNYADNAGANTGGQLTALDVNGNPIATVNLLTGDFSGQDFQISPTGSGGSSVIGGAAASTALPLYRFFDGKTGTQFLTANTGEKSDLTNPASTSYRPDLVMETNTFGAIDPSVADPAKAPVFRFFDSVYGTHFFTSSQAEATGISTPGTTTYRSDLVAEPTATFYEDSTMQSGDVAVYRLFDTTHGTHFYTGSATELAGITTPGSSSYRPDLVNEGVSFYAPAGSFS